MVRGRGNVSSVNPTFGLCLCRRCAFTHETKVEYLTPAFFANAFCVSPLSGYARTSASYSAAGVIRRPRSSFFASSNSVAMVAIATSYTTHPFSPTWSPAGRLQTNGVVERFNRTLKVQIIHGRTYRNRAELAAAVSAFVTTYNREWRLEKLRYKSPLEARRDYQPVSLLAA